MGASIIGWGHTAFGRLAGTTVESLIVDVVREAVAHAGIEYREIDEIFLGHFNAGFSAQDFTAALVLQASPALRFKPATRTENACASGSAALHQGLRAIESGRARVCLVVGVEKMTDAAGAAAAQNLLRASYLPETGALQSGFAGVFARIAEAYFARYGDQSDALALIAAKNHANGVHNPLAHVRKDLGYEFCRQVSDKNPLVAGPLRRTDCSPVSDGAAAVVLADDDVAVAARRAVGFRAATHVQDFLPQVHRDSTRLEGCTEAWERALKVAGVTLADLSFVETHDCFTIAELMEYEAMGLVPAGEGARVIREGWTQLGGRLPVNPSGGLKAKGHPVGATGVSMHVVSAMQLCNEAATRSQVADPKLGGVYNMGGAAVANYVSILERRR
jgi:acetyl-CoA C-acetyltransferase